MLLNTYQNNIVSIIQKYVDNGYIMSFNFSVDTKSNYIGFIQGSRLVRKFTTQSQ